jgi:IS5 family transposase
MKVRTPLYRDLLKVSGRCLGYADHTIAALDKRRSVAALTLRAEIQHYATLMAQVIDQTQRRVFFGESVPAGDKVVSLFEPHTAILKRGGRRKTEYGHKVCLTTGRSGLVLDLTVQQGNTADSAMTVNAVRRVAKLLGSTPEQATFDAGFASQANQKALVEMGVTDAAFAKNSAIDFLASVTSTKEHRALQRLRAGIEASISWLKRSFGLGRCTWSGFQSFKAYVWSATLAANLLQLARLTS